MSKASVFSPVLPESAAGSAAESVRWGGLYGSARALALVRASQHWDGPLLVLLADEQQAYWLESELKFFLEGSGTPVYHFPDLETLPYDVFSPQSDIISRRLETLKRLPQLKDGIVLVAVGAAMLRVPPKHYIDGEAFTLNTGDSLDIDETRTRLEKAGYRCVSQVADHGEFAVRGSLFDLYPMGTEKPLRIDLFDDEIESIRTFDADTQRSEDKLKRFELLPAREFSMSESSIADFRRRYRDQISADTAESIIYDEVSRGNAPGGIEYYLPLFFETVATLFDYIPDNALFIRVGDLEATYEHEWQEIDQRFEQRGVDPERPLLHPTSVFMQPAEVLLAQLAFPAVDLSSFEDTSPDAVAFATIMPPAVSINPQAPEPMGLFKRFLEQFSGRVLVVAESAGRREALLDNLKDAQMSAPVVDSWKAFREGEQPIAVTVGQLQNGMLLTDPDIAVITETQLMGGKPKSKRRRRTDRDPASIIRDLTDLRVGAPVVHEEHGVGRYQGMERMELGGVPGEYLILLYADDDKLYIPVQSLHFISRYTGADEDSAPLHRLGTGAWEKAKKKAMEKAFDVAAELLDVQARRAARVGTSHDTEAIDYLSFAAGFPFEETDDQQRAIEAVLTDMQSSQPMDRIVCGDVGFGKTEVAMRAVFVAAQNGHQVAILAPTTLLVQQHYNNFKDRFADWPVEIAQLSRFRSKKQQDITLDGLSSGKIDIVIGTHKLLQDDIKFKKLGLVVVDEEQRFGVRHKERLKKMRAEVDLLTLTATPIPRTLNMAMSGIRDMSIIATAPVNRLAVKTFVTQWNDGLIVEACLRELRRGGQVYFLHNKVDTIEARAAKLREILPEAKIEVAHGQMRETELEQVMLDFYHRRFNILLCTTIIETGIDFPNANTIIIERADHFGLSQLHQLRGRVGRSHHRAYCYLLAPHKKDLTKDAVKRLEAIESLEDLGAGFTLATHDLEIRGAGELLGSEQSGNMTQVGFALYTDILQRAIKALKSGQEPDLSKPLEKGPEVDLGVVALIPDEYLPDVHTRLVFYKRIANAEDKDQLKELEVEMIDRFGLLPPQTKNLFASTQLKLRAEALGIRKLDAGPRGGRVEFVEQPNIDPMKIIQLIQAKPNTYKFDGGQKLRVTHEMDDPGVRFLFFIQLMKQLAD